MSATVELDPVDIRHRLATQREKGAPWNVAWPEATRHHRVSEDERTIYVFMEKHFRAAYFDTPSSLGRCTVPERDTSMALVMTYHRRVPLSSDRCRSGDECDRLATRGRFGKHFCERHGAELDRIAERVSLDTQRANPTIGGNNGISIKKRAA